MWRVKKGVHLYTSRLKVFNKRHILLMVMFRIEGLESKTFYSGSARLCRSQRSAEKKQSGHHLFSWGVRHEPDVAPHAVQNNEEASERAER